MREVTAPAGLEGALVAAFRERRAAAPVAPAVERDTSARWWLGAVAAVALVAVSVGAGRWLATHGNSNHGARRHQPAAKSHRRRRHHACPRAHRAWTLGGGSAGGGRRTRPATAVPRDGRAGARPSSPPEDGGVERVTYTSLPAALPRWSDEPLVPVRLQLPYAALPALGVQITREQWGETVPVEVLVGEDGIARGIRLVNNEVMRSIGGYEMDVRHWSNVGMGAFAKTACAAAAIALCVPTHASAQTPEHHVESGTTKHVMVRVAGPAGGEAAASRRSPGRSTQEAVPQAPYSADAVTEVTQTLADGNRINRRTVSRIYRDAAGRVRREQAVLGRRAHRRGGRGRPLRRRSRTPSRRRCTPSTRHARRRASCRWTSTSCMVRIA